METLKRLLKTYYQELILVLLTGIIFVVNLSPGRYLLGWDSLQTELNPLLGIQRSLFSVWQEFQSFGLTAGMAHAADLIRSLLIFPLTLLLPNWLVRYTFHMLMLLFAGLSMLKLLRLSGLAKNQKSFALVGSIFYMLNYAVIQMMHIPFEAFSVFFATLPYLLTQYITILTNKHSLKPRDWLIFLLINILATPAFVAQQLFVVYGLILALFTVGVFIPKPSFQIARRALLGALFVIITNLFWLLPQGYFLLTNGSVVTTSKINQIATEDVLYSNIDRGHLTDFLSFIGFFNDRLDQNQNLLFASWHVHRENPVIIIIMIIVVLIMFLGIFQKSVFRIPFVLIGLLVGIALLGSTEPFATLNTFIRSQDFVNQIFRSPFTKFAIPHALIGAYFFTFGLVFLSTHAKHISKHLTQHMAKHIIFGVSLFLIFFQALPVFQGQFFSPTMKVAIPNEYTSLITYLNTQDPSSRIGLLPDYTFWGWIHTKWGYNGSGFLWYGVKQPIVSRNFDYWSKESEGYFWELKQAIEAEDSQALIHVLRKYDIDYLLLDTSLLPLVADQKTLQYDLLETMLSENVSITKEQAFGFLTLYKVNDNTNQNSFISVAKNLPNIGPAIHLTNDDTAYKTYGTYQTDETKPYDSYFPFLDLMTQTKFESENWRINDRPASFGIETTLPESVMEYEATSAAQTSVNIYTDDTAVKYIVPLDVTKQENRLNLSFPKLSIDSFSPENAAVGYCLLKMGTLNYTKAEHDIHITTNDGATGCIEYKDPTLDQRYGYLVQIAQKNTDGLGLYFYILDTTKEQAYVEDRLTTPNSYYILGPHFTRGLGYSFTFQNTSYRTIPSTNTLEDLSVYLMPYDIIKSYELKPANKNTQTAEFASTFEVTKENVYKYTVVFNKIDNPQTLILSQSYQPGWKAYALSSQSKVQGLLPMFFTDSLSSHIAVNNWANGWTIDQDSCSQAQCTILLLYLPQYLEFIGLTLGILTASLLILASVWPQIHRRRS